MFPTWVAIWTKVYIYDHSFQLKSYPFNFPLSWHITVKVSDLRKSWALTVLFKVKNKGLGISLVVQGLRLHAPNPGGPGSIPGQGTRSHMLQLKNLRATTK